MKKLLMLAVAALSANSAFVSHAYAVDITSITETVVAVPSEITELLVGARKEVIIEAKKQALVAVQCDYTQVSPMLIALIEEIRAEKPEVTKNMSDESLINTIAGFDLK
ncbi:MAG: hypothetical protein ACXVCY_08805 [Pseudobdellovibrionaceae bacterium]